MLPAPCEPAAGCLTGPCSPTLSARSPAFTACSSRPTSGRGSSLQLRASGLAPALSSSRHRQRRRTGQQRCQGLPDELSLSAAQLLRSGQPPHPVAEVAEGLEAPVQLLYLVTVLGFLVVGAYLVVRQVLVRRELEEAAKVLGEKVRSDAASADDCFELGVILLRKKLYTQATKNLERAVRLWDGDPAELAQVYNALGYAYSNMGRLKDGVQRYRRAVELQPGYVTAWNNLGDVQEKAKNWQAALDAYREVLSYDAGNDVAKGRVKYLEAQQLAGAGAGTGAGETQK